MHAARTLVFSLFRGDFEVFDKNWHEGVKFAQSPKRKFYRISEHKAQQGQSNCTIITKFCGLVGSSSMLNYLN